MIRGRSPLGRVFAVVAIAGACALALAAEQWDKQWYWKDVPYVPTPQLVVDAMLDLAGVTKADVVYDLGSGDGRIVITAAASYGARGVGIEHHPRLVERSRQQALEAGVDALATFRREDLFESDFREATVVTMYLTPRFMKKLSPYLLEQLEPGTRIVAHKYKIPGWTPVRKVKARGRPVYLYVIEPERPWALDEAGAGPVSVGGSAPRTF